MPNSRSSNSVSRALAALALATSLLAPTALADPLTSGCADVVSQVFAQACVMMLQGICDSANDWDDDGDHVDASDDAPHRAEPPPPAWQPPPGAILCDVTVDEDGALKRVSCADGLRATFVNSNQAGVMRIDSDTQAGDACAGRVRVQGRDDNNNGALDIGEITGRTIDCAHDREVFAPTLQGDLAITTDDDVMRLAGHRAITGGLLIVSDTLVSLDAPALRFVGGGVRIARSPQLQSFTLPALVTVVGDLSVISLPRLTQLRLPSLATTTGVVVTDNPALPQREVEGVVLDLTHRGFRGPVLSGGNAP